MSQDRSNGPPSRYELSDVVIGAVRQPGNPNAGRDELEVHGNGVCRYHDRAQRRRQDCRTLARDDVIDLLNRFYALRFFSLQDSYTTRYRVFLHADGTLQTVATRPADTGSTTLCVTIGSYRKCVTFSEDAPAGLDELATAVFELARR